MSDEGSETNYEKPVAAGKKLAKKNRQAKAALEREVKREREMAEKEQENENSQGWLPEMSFQTVLSIVGIAFTAIELYQRFRQKESSGVKAWGKIRSKFPKVGTTKFTATLDEIGRVFVKLIRGNAKYLPLFNKDGELNEKLPKTIKDALGPPAEDIIRTKEEEISRREKKIQELQASRETASENQKEQIDANIEEEQNEISRLDTENERIEERMSLRDRVKLIFKKYGFTVFAVVSAVGLVIGVIVNNLKKGLTSLGKGVGGALKNIGKKLERFCLVLLSYCKFRFQNSRRSGWFSCEKRLVIDSRCGNVYD